MTMKIEYPSIFSEVPKRQGLLNDKEQSKTPYLSLQRRADEIKISNEKEAAMYRFFQQNITRSEALLTEITKGMKAGEGVGSLFLKACEALSLLTSDRLFYEQAQKYIEH